MAHDATTLVKSRRFGSVTRKAIMLVLADYADTEWSTFAGQERIAAEAEVSPRTVRSVLAEFEGEGLIVRSPRMRQDGRGRSADRTVLVRGTLEDLPAAFAGYSLDQPATGDDQPATGDDQPATGDDQPATGDDQPATALPGNHQKEPSDIQPLTTFGVGPAEVLIIDDTRSDPDTGLLVWVDPGGKVRRRQDDLWDTAARIWAEPLTKTERGVRNRQIAELRASRITPTQLAEAAAAAVILGRGEARYGLAGVIRNLGDLLGGLKPSPAEVDAYQSKVREGSMMRRAAELDAQLGTGSLP